MCVGRESRARTTLLHAGARVGHRRSLHDGGSMTSRSIVTGLLASLMLATGVPASAQQATCLAGKTNCMSEKGTGVLQPVYPAKPPPAFRPAIFTANASAHVYQLSLSLSVPSSDCFSRMR